MCTRNVLVTTIKIRSLHIFTQIDEIDGTHPLHRLLGHLRGKIDLQADPSVEEDEHDERPQRQEHGPHPVDVPHVVNGVQAEGGGLDYSHRRVGPGNRFEMCLRDMEH